MSPTEDEQARRARAIIVARLAHWGLSLDRPDPIEVLIADGPAATDCAACTKPIEAGQVYHLYRFRRYPPGAVHESCDRIWNEERHAGRPDAAGHDPSAR